MSPGVADGGARTVAAGGRTPSAAASCLALELGEGPTVLLVHGQPGSGADWWELASRLAADHRVLAPDRPGWGSCSAPATGIAENARQLAALLDADGGGPATVVGHSFGAGVALALATSRRDLVRSLVLVGPVGTSAALSRVDALLARPLVGELAVRSGAAALRAALRVARSAAAPARVREGVQGLERYASVRALATRRPGAQPPWESFAVEQRALVQETPALERSLASLELPVALVHGTRDRVVPLSASRFMASRVPGAEVVVVRGAGHLLPFERADVLEEVVRRYATALVRAVRPRTATPAA